MTRLAALACSALFVSLFATSACSGDDDDTPPSGDGSGNSGGESDGGRSGSGGRGGTASQGGGDAGGVGNGGAQGSPGGAPHEAGGEGMELGGAAGAGGERLGTGGEPQQPEPDLIASSGGPWPDSFTGLCSNASTLTVCPKQGEAFFGQDGTYRINVPTYRATASTLTDEVTELVWQITPPEQPLTHTQATSYCDELELAGQTDWRLPTRLEYISLLDEGKGAGYALPADIPFDTTGTFWTASASGVTPTLFFVVDDAEGTWNVFLEGTELQARCVRGAALSGALEADNGVVIDTMTSLTWQASELTNARVTWEEALDYCETLGVGGKEDWRLPSIKELATLIDESATVAPVIAASFGAVAERKYWSSTPTAPFLSDPAAFVLDTDFGISMSLNMSETSAARCVRTAD